MKNKDHVYEKFIDFLETQKIDINQIEELIDARKAGIPEFEREIAKMQSNSSIDYFFERKILNEMDKMYFCGYDPVSKKVILRDSTRYGNNFELFDCALFIFGKHQFQPETQKS
ncbi:hypothetical protein AAK899_12260 [Erysipelotrichaceae bacterium 51-3]